MKAHIWYGSDGQILAVGSIQGDAKVIPGSDAEGVDVMEVDVSEEQFQKLHETHRVDMSSRSLVSS